MLMCDTHIVCGASRGERHVQLRQGVVKVAGIVPRRRRRPPQRDAAAHLHVRPHNVRKERLAHDGGACVQALRRIHAEQLRPVSGDDTG